MCKRVVPLTQPNSNFLNTSLSVMRVNNHIKSSIYWEKLGNKGEHLKKTATNSATIKNKKPLQVNTSKGLSQ